MGRLPVYLRALVEMAESGATTTETLTALGFTTWTILDVTPAPLIRTPLAFWKSLPLIVASTVLPCWAPHGNTYVTTGCGGWACTLEGLDPCSRKQAKTPEKANFLKRKGAKLPA